MAVKEVFTRTAIGQKGQRRASKSGDAEKRKAPAEPSRLFQDGGGVVRSKLEWNGREMATSAAKRVIRNPDFE